MAEEQKDEGEDREAEAASAPEGAAGASGADDAGDDEEAGDDAGGEGGAEASATEPAAAADGGDDGDDEPAAAPAAAPKTSGAKVNSAGARLAAAKAAKAAKKAAKRAREQAEAGAVPSGMTGGASKPAEEVLAESAIGQAATKANQWAQDNRPIAYAVVAIAVLALAGWGGWTWWQQSQASAAGVLLADAVEIANADIEAEPATPEPASDDEDEDEDPTFPTRAARAEAALTAYGEVVSQYGGTEAARWARLGQGWAHLELGHTEEARAAYEAALSSAGSDQVVAWRALEGIGFTYEAAEDWDGAIAKYEQLGQIDDGAYSAPADYHIARMRIAKGETVEATSALRTLIERIQQDSEDSEPAFPFVLAQAEIRLRELDPTAAGGAEAPTMIGPGGAGGGGLPEGLDGLPPEILEQLRRQLQEGAGGGGPPGGGGGGGEE